MNSNPKEPSPPEGLPERLVSDLNELSAEELRLTIIYTRELLQVHEEPGPLIEPSTGEEIIRVTERDGYTEVVKRAPCGEDCDDCPHGPYLYHVTKERHPSGEERLHWVFIGKVEPNDS